LKLKIEHIAIGVGLLFVGLFMTFKTRLINKLASFIPSVEGFRSTPYWDVNRYSWGYGTAAPGATGTITREQAFADMLSHLLTDYSTLSNKITRTLTINQWAALLSFSYNLGIGNALQLVPVINANDDQALETKWIKYVYAGGSINQDLVTRRQKEILLWNS
jgi:lysozyme